MLGKKRNFQTTFPFERRDNGELNLENKCRRYRVSILLIVMMLVFSMSIYVFADDDLTEDGNITTEQDETGGDDFSENTNEDSEPESESEYESEPEPQPEPEQVDESVVEQTEKPALEPEPAESSDDFTNIASNDDGDSSEQTKTVDISTPETNESNQIDLGDDTKSIDLTEGQSNETNSITEQTDAGKDGDKESSPVNQPPAEITLDTPTDSSEDTVKNETQAQKEETVSGDEEDNAASSTKPANKTNEPFAALSTTKLISDISLPDKQFNPSNIYLSSLSGMMNQTENAQDNNDETEETTDDEDKNTSTDEIDDSPNTPQQTNDFQNDNSNENQTDENLSNQNSEEQNDNSESENTTSENNPSNSANDDVSTSDSESDVNSNTDNTQEDDSENTENPNEKNDSENNDDAESDNKSQPDNEDNQDDNKHDSENSSDKEGLNDDNGDNQDSQIQTPDGKESEKENDSENENPEKQGDGNDENPDDGDDKSEDGEKPGDGENDGDKPSDGETPQDGEKPEDGDNTDTPSESTTETPQDDETDTDDTTPQSDKQDEEEVITPENPDETEEEAKPEDVDITKPEEPEKVIDITESSSDTDMTGTYSGGSYGYTPTYTYPYTYNPYQYTNQVLTRDAWLNTLTPYERMLTNMRSTEKVPAVVKNDAINVYEGKGDNARIVGTIPAGGICYILEDGEWAYVESGQVRGFVKASLLLTGDDAVSAISVYGEAYMLKGQTLIDPTENQAFTYLNITTQEIPQMPTYSGFGLMKTSTSGPSINRNDVTSYAKQFIGRPYLWGGDDLWNGTDDAGFVRGVFSHFGIQLPRTAYEQSFTGERINAQEARPGDLLFYSENGVVYHVVLYIGNGRAIEAQSQNTGILETDVDYSRVCWGIRLLPDSDYSSTQAIDLVMTGRLAANGDEEARSIIIHALADAAENEWETYGFPKSVLIAQTIQESNWVSFESEETGGLMPSDNNILGMNEELLNDEWDSPWTGEAAKRSIAQIEDGEVVYGDEMMRTYSDIESCIDDYAAFKVGLHPELQGETDVDIIIEEGFQGYATDPDYQSSIKRLIEEYDLTQFDTPVVSGGSNIGMIDGTSYTQEQLELIWAITAQEDDKSYEGALAVITTAMNRADQNYNGYGTDALSQLTADGEFCYSASVSDPIYYQRRLGGNVPEYVKQAVSDCLQKGARNHTYTNFRSSNRTGTYVQIGANWYF